MQDLCDQQWGGGGGGGGLGFWGGFPGSRDLGGVGARPAPRRGVWVRSLVWEVFFLGDRSGSV